MPASPSRRRILATAGGVAATALAGCLGTGMPHDAEITTRRVADIDAGSDGVSVLHYADLPTAEQRIVDDALADGVYHACPDLPNAIRSFASRTGSSNDTYLEHGGGHYGLWVRVEDLVYASTASPPDDRRSCGWF